MFKRKAAHLAAFFILAQYEKFTDCNRSTRKAT